MNYSFSFGFRCLIFLVVAAVPCHADGEESSGAVVNVSIDFPKVMELVAKEDQEPGSEGQVESSDFSKLVKGPEKRQYSSDHQCGGWQCSGTCSKTGVDQTSSETTTYKLCICWNGTVKRDVEGCKAETTEDLGAPEGAPGSAAYLTCGGLCGRPGKRENEDQLVELIEKILHN